MAQRVGGGSFLSANDGRLHFGLGEATRVETIEVRWPSGHVDRYAGLEADAAYLLREGQPQAGLLRGWRRRLSATLSIKGEVLGLGVPLRAPGSTAERPGSVLAIIAQTLASPMKNETLLAPRGGRSA